MPGRSAMLTSINLHRLDLPSLRLVVECTRAGSLSAAAQVCHMSVSGASHKLARLEEGLGAALFLRHRRGLAATEAGRRVALASLEIFESLDAMARLLEESKAGVSVVRAALTSAGRRARGPRR